MLSKLNFILEYSNFSKFKNLTEILQLKYVSKAINYSE